MPRHITNFNDSHPEKWSDEQFVANSMGEKAETAARIAGYSETKYWFRVGRVAYTARGAEVEGYKPIFRRKKRYDKNNNELDRYPCAVCRTLIEVYEVCESCAQGNDPFDFDADRHQYLSRTEI